jgi:hypothetical protein
VPPRDGGVAVPRNIISGTVFLSAAIDALARKSEDPEWLDCIWHVE